MSREAETTSWFSSPDVSLPYWQSLFGVSHEPPPPDLAAIAGSTRRPRLCAGARQGVVFEQENVQ